MKKIILASQSPRRLEILRNHGIEPIVMPSDADEILPEEIGMKEAVMLLAEQKARAVYKDILNGRIPDKISGFFPDFTKTDSADIQPSINTDYPDKYNSYDCLRCADSPESSWYTDSLIIGSDTIVYKDAIMGKPIDANDAFRMLSSIRNTVHYVATGVAVIEIPKKTFCQDNITDSHQNTTEVYFEEKDSKLIMNANEVHISDNPIISVLCDVTEVHCRDYTDEQIWEYIEQEQPYDKAGAYAIQGSFVRYIDYIVGDYENVVGLPFHLIKDYL